MATLAIERTATSKKTVRDLFLRLVLISVFPVLIYGFPLALMWRGGEFVPEASLIHRQTDAQHQILYGPAYSDPSPQFKFASLIDRRLQVMALGTSRVLQFRQQFFNPGVRFYNAGLTVRYAGEFDRVLDAIPPGHEPRVIIVSIDQYMLNPNWPQEPFLRYEVKPKTFWESVHSASGIFFASWKQFYEDFRAHKISIARVLDSRNSVSIRAIMTHSGYRNDGSEASGTSESLANPKRFAVVDIRIRKGVARFEPGQQISQERLAELRVFLEHARARGIYVVGFLPPFPPHIYDQIYHSPKYGYLEKLYPALKPAFAEFGFPFFDYSDARSVGGSDAEAIDGLHCSEKTYLRLYLDMLRHDSVLRSYSNPVVLSKALEEAHGNFYVFSNY